MIIRVSELPENGLTVDDPARLGAPFADASWRLDQIQLTVAPDGADVIVHGWLRATAPVTCGRCLEAFPITVEAPVDVRLAPRPAAADSVELAAEDLDVDFYDHDQIDLGRILDNEATLALPMKPLCRDDCRGLCPTCGGNRNVAPCTCQERPPDPRLAALKGLAGRLSR